MRYPLFPILLLLAAIGCASPDKKKSTPAPANGSAPNPYLFEVKSGMLELSTIYMEKNATDTNGAQHEKVIVYFDDYGSRMAALRYMVGTKDSLQTIMADGLFTRINLAEKAALQEKSVGLMPNGMPNIPVPEMMELLRQRPSFHDLGTKEILGREASGIKLDTVGASRTVWIWKRIPLWMENKMEGLVWTISEVTKLETDIEIPEEKFKIPEGVRIVHGIDSSAMKKP